MPSGGSNAEELQLENDDVKTSLAHLFKSLGGKDAKDHLARICDLIFKTKLTMGNFSNSPGISSDTNTSRKSNTRKQKTEGLNSESNTRQTRESHITEDSVFKSLDDTEIASSKAGKSMPEVETTIFTETPSNFAVNCSVPQNIDEKEITSMGPDENYPKNKNWNKPFHIEKQRAYNVKNVDKGVGKLQKMNPETIQHSTPSHRNHTTKEWIEESHDQIVPDHPRWDRADAASWNPEAAAFVPHIALEDTSEKILTGTEQTVEKPPTENYQEAKEENNTKETHQQKITENSSHTNKYRENNSYKGRDSVGVYKPYHSEQHSKTYNSRRTNEYSQKEYPRHDQYGNHSTQQNNRNNRTYEGRGHSDRIDPHSRDRTYEGRGRGRVEPRSRDQERGDYHGRGRYQGNKNWDSQRDDRRPSGKSYSRTPKENYGNSLPGNRNQFDGNEENWDDWENDSTVSEDQQHSTSREETIDNWEPENVSNQSQRVKKETSDVGSQKTSSVWNMKFSSKPQHSRSLADPRMERENKSSRESHSREKSIDDWEPDNVLNQPHGESQRVEKETPDVGSPKTSSVSERQTNESYVQKKENLGTNKVYDAWNDDYEDGWKQNVKQRKSFPESSTKEVSENKRRSDSRIQKYNTDFYDRSFEKEDVEYKEFRDKFIKENIDFVKVTEKEKDLFEMPKDYSLGHCVAEDMRMGSGIAVNFKRDFKGLGGLLHQRQKQGGLAVLEVDNETGKRYIYYLVTKKVSTGKPTYETFWSSLKKMRDHIQENGVNKLAIPRIGCGLDRLEWSRVKYMVEFLFRNVSIEIVVCNFQQNEDSPQKGNLSNKLVNHYQPLKDIDEYTIILYLSTEDGNVSEEMEELNQRFNFLSNFRQSPKKLGISIRTEWKNYLLYGCIVRKTVKAPFDFESFAKCLSDINKNNNKDKFEYVALQVVYDETDDILNEKIITLLRDRLKRVDIYMCYGKRDENQTTTPNKDDKDW
ncbi:hypothetical protein JTB14_036628 [Gonioctena quinquepunctata]|nr:hypothetical protein JTB14_036628 [Gonioctena quinquepunctata]